MNKVRVKIDNLAEFKRLAGLVDSSYVTCYIYNNVFYVMFGNTEEHIQYSFDIVYFEGMVDDIVFKMLKSQFISLLIEGTLVATFLSDRVLLEYVNKENKTVYKITIDYILDSLESCKDKLKVLSTISSYPRLDLEDTYFLVRIARSLGVQLTSEDNISYLALPDFKIYKPKPNPNFCISGKRVNVLKALDGETHCADNCIVTTTDRSAIIMRTEVNRAGCSYDTLSKYKVQMKFKIKLSDLLRLSRKVKLSLGRFILDFEEGLATFRDTETKYFYSTGIEVFDVVTPKKKVVTSDVKLEKLDIFSDLSSQFKAQPTATWDFANPNSKETNVTRLPKIAVPSRLLSNVLPAFGVDSIIQVKVKKLFIELHVHELIIVIGRTEVDE